MQLILESDINPVLTLLESEAALDHAYLQMVAEQPDLCAFIDSDTQNLLTDDELHLLTFLATTIYHVCQKKQKGTTLSIPGKELEKWEETNWETWNQQESRPFRSRADVFFSGYEQEDLLALVEDSILDEEEGIVTQVGREIIMVVGKSIIDTIKENN